MQPLRLRMIAFGPFAGEEIIEFTSLGKNPLFLINGPTGSGKSTILDAICFALYGETTGNERQGRQMRCDQADPAVLTEVTFDFLLGERTFRVTRAPDQERPKAKGQGTTLQKSRAELHEIIEGEEQLIAAPKVTEVTQEVERLTGLTSEQFRQVMVLPQGRFRELLLARSEDREEIFQQLFQTHIYSALTTKLRDQAITLTTQMKELKQQQQTLLSHHEQDSMENLIAEIDAIGKLIEQLAQQKKSADEALVKAQSHYQQAELLDNAFQEQKKAQTRLREFEGQQADISQIKQLLQRSKQAAEIDSLYQALLRERTALVKAEKQIRDCTAALSNSEAALQLVNKEHQSLPGMENNLADVVRKLNELDGYRTRASQLESAITELGATEAKMRAAQTQFDEQTSHLNTLKKRIDEEEQSYKDNTKSVTILPEKRQNLKNLEQHKKVLTTIESHQATITRLDKSINGLGEQEQQAHQLLQEKRRNREIYEQAWHHGQAAILAANLQPGESCPVCGSTSHPQLATADEKLPTEQELNQVREKEERARTALETCQRDKLLKEQERNETQNQLVSEKNLLEDQPALTLYDIDERIQECQTSITQLQNMHSALPALEGQIAKMKADELGLEQLIRDTQKILTENTAEQAAAKANVQSKRDDLPEPYREPNALEVAVQSATTQREALTVRIKDLRQRYQQARENKVAAETALQSAFETKKSVDAAFKAETSSWEEGLQQSAFSNEKEFLEAILEKAQEMALANQVREFEDAYLLAQKQCEEKNAAVAAKERPDLSKFATDREDAQANKSRTDEAFHKTTQRKSELEKTQTRILQTQKTLFALEEKYGLIGKLSDISYGKNLYNLSLQRFVLSVLLDDVLTEASYRLHKMSKGRYELYRKEDVEDKRVKSGLELVVEDAYTGKQRAAETLSGGESFMAALALALGLSDVIQSYAGGIRLDTLFIDEGFGSLDPESLDLAIQTLLELRKSGRMIGLISHVDEMKRIIDVRIDVVSSRGVSHTILHGV